MSDLSDGMKKTGVPDFYKWGIRALALFQLYLVYLVLSGSGFRFETLSRSNNGLGIVILAFLSYILWVSTGENDAQFKVKVALGCVAVGLLPLMVNLAELVIGSWEIVDWVLLSYFLIGSGSLLDVYFKSGKNEK